MTRFGTIALLSAILSTAAPTADRATQGQRFPSGDAVVLVTLDGARVEEVFGGLDVETLRSTPRPSQPLEEQPAWRRFWAPTPEGRREKLMPFFWGTLMKAHGSIAGNPRLGSAVRLANRHRISYPGYAEILLGEAHDDLVASNDPVRNPHATLLEELRARLDLPREKVAAFASWGVFNAIAERIEGSMIAFVSPSMPQRGEWRDHAPLSSSQVAATLAGWLGIDWSAERPNAGRAIR